MVSPMAGTIFRAVQHLSAMRDYAKKRRWPVAVEVQDVGSGATTRSQREELIEAAASAHKWGYAAPNPAVATHGSPRLYADLRVMALI